MSSWGRKGCVRAPEVSPGLMPLRLPLSKEARGLMSHSRTAPRWSLLGGERSGGARLWHHGGCQAWEAQLQRTGGVSKDTEQRARGSYRGHLFDPRFQPHVARWGINKGIQDPDAGKD